MQPMNMFKAKTEKDQNTELIDKAKKLRELQELEQLGRDLLADARYARYRDKFDKLLGAVIQDLIAYNHADNNIYAVNVRTLIQQLKDLMAFLNAPVNFLNHVEVQRINLETGGKHE